MLICVPQKTGGDVLNKPFLLLASIFQAVLSH